MLTRMGQPVVKLRYLHFHNFSEAPMRATVLFLVDSGLVLIAKLFELLLHLCRADLRRIQR